MSAETQPVEVAPTVATISAVGSGQRVRVDEASRDRYVSGAETHCTTGRSPVDYANLTEPLEELAAAIRSGDESAAIAVFGRGLDPNLIPDSLGLIDSDDLTDEERQRLSNAAMDIPQALSEVNDGDTWFSPQFAPLGATALYRFPSEPLLRSVLESCIYPDIMAQPGGGGQPWLFKDLLFTIFRNDNAAIDYLVENYPGDVAYALSGNLLISAIESGNDHLFDVALDVGADVNADRDGWTPLDEARRSSRIDLAQRLIERGADPSRILMRCCGGGPAIAYENAIYAGNVDVLELF